MRRGCVQKIREQWGNKKGVARRRDGSRVVKWRWLCDKSPNRNTQSWQYTDNFDSFTKLSHTSGADMQHMQPLRRWVWSVTVASVSEESAIEICLRMSLRQWKHKWYTRYWTGHASFAEVRPKVGPQEHSWNCHMHCLLFTGRITTRTGGRDDFLLADAQPTNQLSPFCLRAAQGDSLKSTLYYRGLVSKMLVLASFQIFLRDIFVIPLLRSWLALYSCHNTRVMGSTSVGLSIPSLTPSTSNSVDVYCI